MERDNRINICNNIDLVWINEFVSLGIQYDTNNMGNITHINIRNNLTEIEARIAVWKPRYPIWKNHNTSNQKLNDVKNKAYPVVSSQSRLFDAKGNRTNCKYTYG